MPSGQRRRRTVSKHLASSMSDCMCIMAPVSPMGRDGTSTRYKASDPKDKERCQLPGIRIEPINNAQYEVFDKKHAVECTTQGQGMVVSPMSHMRPFSTVQGAR